MSGQIPIAPQTARIGWVGTGVMGGAIAANLLSRGWRLTVTSRTRSKAEPLLALGADWAETPKKIAETADVVFTMVGFPSDLEAVVFGDDGVLAGFAPPSSEKRRALVDMTTSRPSLARRIFQTAAALRVEALDAPVSGSDTGAKNATLSVMIGGRADTVEWLRPLFESIGKTIVHQGDAGSGQHTKMVNQILIAGNMAGMCEALLYARQNGLDMEKVLASVEKGAAGSWSLSNLVPRILRGDFAPGFFVEHFIKDMRIALEEAEAAGLTLSVLPLVREIYEELQKDGGGRDGTQALIRAVAKRSNLDWRD